ncbi:4'-phosphopantetheinyl transferase family protein [Staphylococcus sp. NAM3COL9]|uniref:4'-phosphopantetheinyl transferase family protein n=1 Tax=Staphylococcus sp. NAM3COL9 TaxID=1667172 RepID=UPI00070D0D5D|nr:4'-phosphopantetheinyl transferase superfamily protein [Staphylococcus sp. NAM3COL9]
MKITVYVLNTSAFIYQKDKRNTRYSELFKYYCIREHTGCYFDDIQFSKEEYGKPVLQMPSGIHLNISHTDGFSVCVVSDKNVGIDIEKIEAIDLDIAKKYFALTEYQYIMNAQNSDVQFNRFFEVWTMKECYLKLLGIGMYKELDSFSITPGRESYNIVETEKNMSQSFSFFHNLVFEKYALSVILETTNQNLVVELLDITKRFNTEFIL